MEELASALPISGAPYTYLWVSWCFKGTHHSCGIDSLNASSKRLALISAALLLLDFVSTSVVSAATAATYVGNEVSLPFPFWVVAALVLLLFVAVSLSGLRETARIALSVFAFHVSVLTL